MEKKDENERNKENRIKDNQRKFNKNNKNSKMIIKRERKTLREIKRENERLRKKWKKEIKRPCIDPQVPNMMQKKFKDHATYKIKERIK